MSTRYAGQPLTTWRGFVNAEGAAAEATATTGFVVHAGTTALSFTLATGGQRLLHLAGTASNTSGISRAAYLCMEGTGISGDITGLTVDANGSAATTGTGQLLGADINCYVGASKYVKDRAVALQTWLGGESTSVISGNAWSLWVDCGLTWSTVSGYASMIHISNNGTGLVGQIFSIWGGASYLFRFRQHESGTDAWTESGTLSVAAGSLKIIIGTDVRYIPLYSS